MSVYQIVYYWQGERHVTTETWTSLDVARCVLQKFRQLGWRAHLEEVRS